MVLGPVGGGGGESILPVPRLVRQESIIPVPRLFRQESILPVPRLLYYLFQDYYFTCSKIGWAGMQESVFLREQEILSGFSLHRILEEKKK